MPAAAAQRVRQEPAPREETTERRRVPASAYRAPRTRRRAVQRSRFMRTFIIFVVCLTALAVGRVALSFAVVQKSLQTDAIVREHRDLTVKNAQLQEEIAKLGSPVTIRHQAEKELGLVDANHIIYLRASKGGSIAEVAANR